MYLRNATVGSVVDPITTEKQEKAVFVVFFAGERARIKILKARALPRPAPESARASTTPGERDCSVAAHVMMSSGEVPFAECRTTPTESLQYSWRKCSILVGLRGGSGPALQYSREIVASLDFLELAQNQPSTHAC